MHCHQKPVERRKPLFSGDGYAGLARWRCGTRAACSSTRASSAHHRATPTVQAPGARLRRPRSTWPIRAATVRPRSASPCTLQPQGKRFEFRRPIRRNPYSRLHADGGSGRRATIIGALDKDIYDLSPEEMRNVPSMPGSLEEALSCIEEDHAFLLKATCFTEELLEAFIDYKRKNEADAVRLRPHPTSSACTTNLALASWSMRPDGHSCL